MEDACISPPGSELTCVWVDGDRWQRHAGCHRYDQSVINVILANIYNYDDDFYTTKRFEDFAEVKRGDGFYGQLPSCR